MHTRAHARESERGRRNGGRCRGEHDESTYESASCGETSAFTPAQMVSLANALASACACRCACLCACRCAYTSVRLRLYLLALALGVCATARAHVRT
eukprot:6183764-Pleurochrysis_carterae.AAC.7